MARIVRCGLIQAQCELSPEKFSLAEIKKKMIAKHERLIADAEKKNVQILGLQELFYGPYFNTAAVIDADGRYLGKYRKHHIPHCHPGFWEKFYFTPGNAGYPVFQTRY